MTKLILSLVVSLGLIVAPLKGAVAQNKNKPPVVQEFMKQSGLQSEKDFLFSDLYNKWKEVLPSSLQKEFDAFVQLYPDFKMKAPLIRSKKQGENNVTELVFSHDQGQTLIRFTNADLSTFEIRWVENKKTIKKQFTPEEGQNPLPWLQSFPNQDKNKKTTSLWDLRLPTQREETQSSAVPTEKNFLVKAHSHLFLNLSILKVLLQDPAKATTNYEGRGLVAEASAASSIASSAATPATSSAATGSVELTADQVTSECNATSQYLNGYMKDFTSAEVACNGNSNVRHFKCNYLSYFYCVCPSDHVPASNNVIAHTSCTKKPEPKPEAAKKSKPFSWFKPWMGWTLAAGVGLLVWYWAQKEAQKNAARLNTPIDPVPPVPSPGSNTGVTPTPGVTPAPPPLDVTRPAPGTR